MERFCREVSPRSRSCAPEPPGRAGDGARLRGRGGCAETRFSPREGLAAPFITSGGV